MNVTLQITAICAIFLGGLTNEDAPIFKPIGEKVSVKGGSVWCGLVWDGAYIVVSTENKAGISILKYSESLELVAGHRPHTLFHNDTLYLGYDANGGVFIRRYKLQ